MSFHNLKQYLSIALCLFLAACSGVGEPQSPILAPVMVVASADATVTPTPFQPVPPTPTYVPTAYPTSTPTLTPTLAASPTPTAIVGQEKTWADYPGPTVWPDIAVPAPAGILPEPSGQVNIVLLGTDQRIDDVGFRTDTILLLTLNPSLGTANITSFPRDLYVYIPGWTMQRINTAMFWGGFQSLALTFEYNFGVRPDFFVLINLFVFPKVIDSLGGIDVNVAVTLTDHRDGYGYYTVYPGVVHMDGATALWYVRSRYSTSDFDRGRRQQEVITACFQALLKKDALDRAAQIYSLYIQNVSTNMSFDEMAAFLPLAAKLTDTSRIHHFYISPQQVMDWTNTSGAMVLLPIHDAVMEVMRQALNSP